MRDVQEAFDAWRRADAAAAEAEREVSNAAMQALEGKGPPPSRELLERMHELRAQANVLLTHAMNTMSRESRGERAGPLDESDSRPNEK